MPRSKHLLSTLGLPRKSRRLFRTLRGPVTKGELARILGVHISTVDTWENGNGTPEAHSLRRLLDHYMGWARRYGIKDPLSALHPSAPSARRAPAQDRAGTRPAPSPTARDKEARSPAGSHPTPDPPLPEGPAKENV